MKRLFLFTAICAALLCACTPRTTKVTEQAEDYRTRIELCDNPDTLRILIEQAVAYASTLSDKGRVGEAQMYLDEIRQAVEMKHPKQTSYFMRAMATVDSLPPAAEPDSTALIADSVAADTAVSVVGVE